MVDAPRHSHPHHAAHETAAAPTAKAAAAPQASSAQVTRSQDTFVAQAASVHGHHPHASVAGFVEQAGKAMLKHAREQLDNLAHELPKKFAEAIHDRATDKLKKMVEDSLPQCHTTGEKHRLERAVSALQALNVGKFAHGLIDNLKAEHEASKKGDVKGMFESARGVIDGVRDFLKTSADNQQLRQRVNADCQTDPNSRPRAVPQFHVQPNDIQQLRQLIHRENFPGVHEDKHGIHIQIPHPTPLPNTGITLLPAL